MRKLLLATTALCISLSLATPAEALVVSDPGAYTRFAQMLTKDNQKLTELKKQLTEQLKINQNLSGNLRRGLGVDRILGELQAHSKKITQTIQEIPGISDSKLDARELEKFRDEFLDKLFVPEDHLGKKAVTRKAREDYRQRTVKATIENSEYILSRTSEAMQRFDDLASQVDETQSLKDSTDLLNRLMTELLIIEQQQLELMAQAQRAEKSMYYDGTKTQVEETSEPLSERDQNKKDFVDTIKIDEEGEALLCEFGGGC